MASVAGLVDQERYVRAISEVVSALITAYEDKVISECNGK